MKHLIHTVLVLPLVLVLLSSGSSFAAEDIKRLTTFTDELSSFTADFVQTVYNAESNPIQESNGNISLKRPGRFVWNYLTPNPQQIVADGEKIWLYDQELEQVTVSAISERASGTPLALLMGVTPLADEFDVKGLGVSDDIEWYELTPKTKDTDFETVYLGLKDSGLAVMELRDNFGQATQIKFHGFKSGVDLDDGMFAFKPPAGVDVIGQE